MEEGRMAGGWEADFHHPPACFRGTPFWAWNCRMTKETVSRTLSELKEMGMGGAYIHCRTGMDMPYLGAEFMDMVRYAHEQAGEKGMFTCLYDEDRWPSGYGGGLVTRDEQFRSRFLTFSPKELPLDEEVQTGEMKSCAQAVSSGKRKFLGVYEVYLKDGFLEDYRYWKPEERGLLESGNIERKKGHVWFAYLEVSGDNPWFNNQAYVNTLDENAIRRFIEITYESYEKELGEFFGKDVPCIFTDEPQFSFKTRLGFAEEKTTQTIPYTDDFEQTYRQACGESFLEHLPEIFWELPNGQISVSRYRYHDHVCERFTRAYADQIGSWCRNHHILLTGHMMREPFLEGQTMALGEAMRAYRSFDLPGIDMLCDRRELTTAKQAQSAVHQFGCPGMTSEIYGVTNWDFDFRGHKAAGDWQAALGVTRRVHHLTWTTMAGEAKRDYPAPIGYQSPWYQEYPYIEDYFSRINAVLTRGKALVKVAVIHPVESYWLYWGTEEHTGEIRGEMEENFQNLIWWLLYGLLDFDYVSEALLAQTREQQGDKFIMGEMAYDVVLVPDCVTLRSATVERLERFCDAGGQVIFAGRVPECVDAVFDGRTRKLASRCLTIGFSNHQILAALDEARVVDIRRGSGLRTDNILYQMRLEDEAQWLFLAHGEKARNQDLAQMEELVVKVKGNWNVEQLRPEDGTRQEIAVRREKGWTFWKTESYDHDSFLYHLVPWRSQEFLENPVKASDATEVMRKDTAGRCLVKLPETVSFYLEEPNVLLLDQAEYRFDDGPWQEKEEILRIDNMFRNELGLPLRTEAFAQPWVGKKRKDDTHRLGLRFIIQSECEVSHVKLALERAEETDICWNGQNLVCKPDGWYTDRDIQTIRLGEVKAGNNVLEVSLPFAQDVHVEAMYLLGDFGVALTGRSARLQPLAKTLGFGDICVQGLPFYGGNIRYEMEVEIPEDCGEKTMLQISKFRCPAIGASVDGSFCGLIAVSPYQIELGMLKPGRHSLSLRAYGNRVNTFGPVHNCNETEQWIGPDAWRTTGTSWSYEYQMKKTGILASPEIFTGRRKR